VYVTPGSQAEHTYLVAVDPNQAELTLKETYTINLKANAIAASSGVPVKPLGTGAGGTIEARISFDAQLDSQNRYVVTFDREVFENGGPLSLASFNITQLEDALVGGVATRDSAAITGVTVKQTINNRKVCTVQILTESATNGRERVAINLVPMQVSGADGVPLRRKPDPIKAQLNAEVGSEFSILRNNSVIVRFSDRVTSDTITGTSFVVSLNTSSPTTTLDSFAVATVEEGLTYVIEPRIRGAIGIADSILCNLQFAEVRDTLGQLVRPLRSAAALALTPTATFNATASGDSL